MNDRQRMSQQKTGNQNRAFSARRRENSSVLLYKAENKPWSEQSLQPYLGRKNLEALQKTMPFLNAQGDAARRAALLAQDARLSHKEQAQQSQKEKKHGSELVDLRAQRVALSAELDFVGALVWRRQAQARSFFRKINLTFDLQKQKLFAFYRTRIAARKSEGLESATPETPEKDDDE